MRRTGQPGGRARSPPPWMLTFSSGTPSWRTAWTATAAKASLISSRSRSSTVQPCSSSGLGDRVAGLRRERRRRARPPGREARRVARTVQPLASALARVVRTTAAPPSLMVEELPAVRVPSGRKAGRSLARASTVVSARMPSSASTTVSPRAAGDHHRHDLVGEHALGPRPGGQPVGPGGDRVLFFAARRVVGGALVGVQAHGLVGPGVGERRRWPSSRRRSRCRRSSRSGSRPAGGVPGSSTPYRPATTTNASPQRIIRAASMIAVSPAGRPCSRWWPARPSRARRRRPPGAPGTARGRPAARCP